MFFVPEGCTRFLPEKPTDAAQRIVKILKPHARKTVLPVHTQTPEAGDDNYFHMIPEGYCSLYRKKDNLLLSSAMPPVLIGLTELFAVNNFYCVKTDVECECYSLPIGQAKILIMQYNLWMEVAEMLSYYMTIMFLRDKHLVGVSAYDAIKNTLLEYQQQTEFIKQQTTTANYIQNKTGLARSTIQLILSELRKGGYIDIQKGRLVKINQLPRRF